MRRWLCACCIIILLLQGFSIRQASAAADGKLKPLSKAEAEERWNQIDRLSERLYHESVSEQMVKALGTMKDIEGLLLDRGMFAYMTVEQLNALTGVIVLVKGELQAVQIQQERLVDAASKLRLAVDAITHPKKPMWLQYERVLHQEMTDMLLAQTKEEWLKQSQAWIEHVERIMPAVAITRSPQTVEMMQSLVTLVKQTMQDEGRIDQAKIALRDAENLWMKSLFGITGDQAAWATPVHTEVPWRMIMWLACIVSVTLAYVGYIKYRYREEPTYRDDPRGNSI